MKTTITKEIVKWIGDDVFEPAITYEVSIENIQNSMREQFRDKAPELTDTIVNMIVEEVRNEITDIFIEADQREDRVELYDIEKTLDDLLKD